MKILVIGGTGHIGNFLVAKLLKNGHEVYIGARNAIKPKDQENLKGARYIQINAWE